MLTTLRTIRYLRYSQLCWRIWYVLESRLKGAPRHRTNPSQYRTNLSRIPNVPLFHRLGPVGHKALENLRQGCFEHLNSRRQLQNGIGSWSQPVDDGRDRLWEITFQYHYWLYDLAEIAAENREAMTLLRQFLAEWLTLTENSQQPIPFAWNAYAIATRISWWARTLRVIGPTLDEQDPQLARRMLESMHQQATHLAGHIEWDLRANHVLRDAVGLAWAGRVFEGSEAADWLDLATRIAMDQVAEQVLPDGGHFERSSMYHILVMEDVLALAMLVKDEDARRQLTQTWQRMADYLSWLRRPDGFIPLFNDAAHGAVCKPDSMRSLGVHLALNDIDPFQVRRGGKHFADTGMAIWHGEKWTTYFDVGPVGPDYQPGHAHADNLTLECCCQNVPLVIDPGTVGYDDDERRQYDRSTRSHNTVCIDETDSSEVWHIFRVGRRARPIGVQVESTRDGMHASASHDGYDHLDGAPRHQRKVDVSERHGLTVCDEVVGSQSHFAEGGYLVDPRWTVAPVSGGWKLTHNGHSVMVRVSSPNAIQLGVEARPFHPEFGLETTTNRLVWRSRCALPLKVITTFMSD